MKSEGESNHDPAVDHRQGAALRRDAEERGLYRAAFEHDAWSRLRRPHER